MAGAEWQPIETAPKDGTAVLLCCVAGLPRIEVASFYSRTLIENGAIVSEESYWRHARCESYVIIDRSPTHWMPLPAFPELGR